MKLKMSNDTYNVSDIYYKRQYVNETFGDHAAFKRNIDISTNVVRGFVCVFGSAINIWLLLAILLDGTLRKRLRNQLICSLFIAYLIDTLSEFPVMITDRFRTYFLTCKEVTVRASVDFIQNAVENWLFVFLIAVFITQLLKLDLRTKMGPKFSRIGTFFILLCPWIVALFLIPVAVSMNIGSRKLGNSTLCNRKFTLQQIINGHDISALILGFLLLLISVALKYASLRSGGGLYRLQAEEEPTDPLKAYVLGIVLLSIFELPYHIMPLVSVSSLSMTDFR